MEMKSVHNLYQEQEHEYESIIMYELQWFPHKKDEDSDGVYHVGYMYFFSLLLLNASFEVRILQIIFHTDKSSTYV